MKVAVAMFFLCLIAGMKLSQKPNSSSSKQQNAETSQADRGGAVARGKQPDNTPYSQETTADAAPHWYAPLERPEWDAVLAAIAALLVIGWQSWETRKAAKAAVLGVQISISKERFRIKVRPQDQWNFPVDFDPSTQQAKLRREPWQGVMYDVHCYGLTEGYILEAFDGACVSDSEDAPPLTISPIHNFPWRIDPA